MLALVAKHWLARRSLALQAQTADRAVHRGATEAKHRGDTIRSPAMLPPQLSDRTFVIDTQSTRRVVWSTRSINQASGAMGSIACSPAVIRPPRNAKPTARPGD